MKKIGEGAEATIYITKFMSERAVLKRRASKAYREPRIDISLRRQRTRNEARALALAHDAKVRSPALLMVAEYEIVMGEIDGTVLSRYTPKDNEVSRIMREVGIIAAKLHDAGVAHGDFTPANIMISEGHASVIDFGLATTSPSMEDKAMDLILMKRAIEPKDYAIVESAYRRSCADAERTLSRLRAIERRGRYKTRTLETLKA